MEALRLAQLDTVVHRLNPLTKLFIMLLYWGTALFTFNIPVLLVMTVLALVLYPISHIPLRILRVILSIMAAIFVIFIVINGFMFYGGKTPLFFLFKWPFTLEGMIFGFAVCLKILSVVMMIPLLTSTTTLPKLMAGLAAMRLPYKFIFTFGVAMRLVPLVTSTYFDIMASQRLRGHDISEMNYFKRLIKGYVPLFIPLVLTLLRRTADMDVAIESRGFGAPVKRTYLEEIRPTRADFVALSLSLVVFSGIFYYLFINHGSQMGLIIQFQK
ncbi:MAG: energy-coupling factor transporter transmembrane protein EcfT [Planctomycetes bacterium]|nr:energy-coupling factor transporter transmembrane protein EcfT [Planctomycetota bacterium]